MSVALISRSRQIARQVSAGVFDLNAAFGEFQTVEEGLVDAAGVAQGTQFEAIVQYADKNYSTTWTRCLFTYDSGQAIRDTTLRTKVEGASASTADVDDFNTGEDLVIYGTQSQSHIAAALAEIFAAAEISEATIIAGTSDDYGLVTPAALTGAVEAYLGTGVVQAKVQTAISLSAGVTKDVDFDDVVEDPDGCFDGVTYTAIAAKKYRFTGSLRFQVDSDQDIILLIGRKNGASIGAIYDQAGGIANKSMQFDIVLNLDAGDTFVLQAQNSSNNDVISDSDWHSYINVTVEGPYWEPV